jgi:hypothetical protein
MHDEQDAIEYLQRHRDVIVGRYVLGDLRGIGGTKPRARRKTSR